MPRTKRGLPLYANMDGDRYRVTIPDHFMANWIYHNISLFDIEEPYFIKDIMPSGEMIFAGLGSDEEEEKHRQDLPGILYRAKLKHKAGDTSGKVTRFHDKACFLPVLNMVGSDFLPVSDLAELHPDGTIVTGGTYYQWFMDQTETPYLTPWPSTAYDGKNYIGDTFDALNNTASLEWVVFHGSLIARRPFATTTALELWVDGLI